MSEVVPAPTGETLSAQPSSNWFADTLSSGADFFTAYKTAQWSREDRIAQQDNAALTSSSPVTPQADQPMGSMSMFQTELAGGVTIGEGLMLIALGLGLFALSKKL